VPVHRIVGVLQKIRAGLMNQSVGHVCLSILERLVIARTSPPESGGQRDREADPARGGS
jgi:hypothetical protein